MPNKCLHSRFGVCLCNCSSFVHNNAPSLVCVHLNTRLDICEGQWLQQHICEEISSPPYKYGSWVILGTLHLPPPNKIQVSIQAFPLKYKQTWVFIWKFHLGWYILHPHYNTNKLGSFFGRFILDDTSCIPIKIQTNLGLSLDASSWMIHLAIKI